MQIYPDENRAHGPLVPAPVSGLQSANLDPKPLGTNSPRLSFAEGDLPTIGGIGWTGRLGLRVRTGVARMDRFEEPEIQTEIYLEFLVAERI